MKAACFSCGAFASSFAPEVQRIMAWQDKVIKDTPEVEFRPRKLAAPNGRPTRAGADD